VVRLHSGIIVFCLLSMFAAPAYTQTPDETAFKALYANYFDCRQEPDCFISTNIPPFERFVQQYPTSGRVNQAAEAAGDYYQRAADIFKKCGATLQAQNAAARAAELRNFATGMGKLPAYLKPTQSVVAQQPPTPSAPQYSAATQPNVRPSEPSKPAHQTAAPKQGPTGGNV
jgi:hypothetical protein